MTTTTVRPSALEVLLEPALAAYGTAVDEHRKPFGLPAGADRCSCGWQPARPMSAASRSRAVGLHVAAAEKRATKAYDLAAAAVVERATALTTEEARAIVDAHVAQRDGLERIAEHRAEPATRAKLVEAHAPAVDAPAPAGPRPFRITVAVSGGRTAHTDADQLRALLSDVVLALGEPVVGPVIAGGFGARTDELNLTLLAAFEDVTAANRASSALLAIATKLAGSTVGRSYATRVDGELATARAPRARSYAEFADAGRAAAQQAGTPVRFDPYA